jgi:hypothetical protein
MQMRHVEDVFRDCIDPIVHMDFATRRAKTGLAREGDAMLKVASRAEISSVSAFRISAKHKTLDDVSNVCLLIGGNFFF